ncbi:cadherin repeat domain-containing protein [Portibacter marinus]|uniref:hypothetical protein n=1 Tax=Portibacter marinus TaxID=2898660 RepID=UPI001F2AD6A3
MIALQFNNWNESRKKEEQFKSSLEQLYNKITDDEWLYEYMIRENENIIAITDSLSNLNEQSQVNSRLLMDVWQTTTAGKRSFNATAIPFLERLTYNPESPEQKKLANDLLNYKQLLASKTNASYIVDVQAKLSDELVENSIAFFKFDHNQIMSEWVLDSTWYTSQDLEKAKTLLTSQHFKSLLKTSRSSRSFDILDYKALVKESDNMLTLIKKYHPNVKLIYEDVGIIGTSIDGFDNVGAKSTPMVLIDEEHSIWEITLFLKKGVVKFRCRDSWAINWGGNTFPEGIAEHEGSDIEVPEAGNYKVILNLSEKQYKFIKQE